MSLKLVQIEPKCVKILRISCQWVLQGPSSTGGPLGMGPQFLGKSKDGTLSIFPVGLDTYPGTRVTNRESILQGKKFFSPFF